LFTTITKQVILINNRYK